MKILILEDNLMWSVRLKKAAQAAGHECSVRSSLDKDLPQSDVAVVGLASRTIDPREAVPGLKSTGAYVIGHAGHKEPDLLELGRALGCDRVVTNGEIARKFVEMVAEAEQSCQD
ncbi:MAG: hypothetical protein IIC73_07310 [Armatimonadetes bacterium]|nr:hypothetical protein [Armatimonadota bacterium]